MSDAHPATPRPWRTKSPALGGVPVTSHMGNHLSVMMPPTTVSLIETFAFLLDNPRLPERFSTRK